MSAAATLRSVVAAASLFVGSCALVPPAGPTYVNPVLDGDFPDPAVLRAPDGWFYAYATQGVAFGRLQNIQVARSRNLIEWERLGDGLPEKPHWAATKQMFWAPHVLYDSQQRQYFMYYSAEPNDSRGKCLAAATADKPEGPFADSGEPMLCGRGIEHIDPMAFDDPLTGKRLLYWGSGQQPIRVRELAADRLRFRTDSTSTSVLFPDESEYRSLIEAPWVIFREGFYYLFYSGDRCCAREPRYAVMVARASHAKGPFQHFSHPSSPGSSAILERDGRWTAPGHNSVGTDAAGVDWLVYHAMDAIDVRRADRPAGAMAIRHMLLDRIEYRDGWPRVSGNSPSSSDRPAPTIDPSLPLPSYDRRENERP
jgi:arabinan endo-1,5-alpha-L-arabinosidase